MSDTGSTLSDTDITILNAARGILKEHARHEYDATYREVRVAVVAEHAERAIFDFLSTTSSYLHREMTHEQLHLTPAAVPVPQSLRAPACDHADCDLTHPHEHVNEGIVYTGGLFPPAQSLRA